MNTMNTARLLPWTSPDGKPCYLLGGDGTGYVSRLADRVEAEQMDSAAEFMEEAGGILSGRAWTPGEIHLLAVELKAHLANVHRVSESRGARLFLFESECEVGEVSGGPAAGDASDGGNDVPSAHDFPDRASPEQGQCVPRSS
ncbi:hypothetical protein ACFVFQ_28285 [Streptomyces sp. NPDC057743]|uniref:hypothetical protein n=1 Tax=Streptomyces sp. NPDC057743 TaxID=3346236 RepID=UPI00369E6392